MTEHPESTPPDFAAFRASRLRFFDGLAADHLLRRIEKDAAGQEVPVHQTLEIEGDLVVLSNERRIILGYFSAAQRDLADAIREVLGFTDEAFGVGRVGRVLITIERLAPGASAPYIG